MIKLEEEVNAIREKLEESKRRLEESFRLSKSYGKNKFWQGFFLGVSVASVYYWISYEIIGSKDVNEQRPTEKQVIYENSDKLNYFLSSKNENRRNLSTTN